MLCCCAVYESTAASRATRAGVGVRARVSPNPTQHINITYISDRNECQKSFCFSTRSASAQAIVDRALVASNAMRERERKKERERERERERPIVGHWQYGGPFLVIGCQCLSLSSMFVISIAIECNAFDNKSVFSTQKKSRIKEWMKKLGEK